MIPLRAPLSFLLIFILSSCSLESDSESDSTYEESLIEFKLDSASLLGYDDLQSIKVYIDPYAAFNLHSIYEEGRSVLGAYDYDEDSEIYMGFEYGPLYTSRLEDLSVSVTLKDSQIFIDSAEYTLQFMGEIPDDTEDKPYVQLTVDSGAVTLTPVQGAAGSPLLSITEQ